MAVRYLSRPQRPVAEPPAPDLFTQAVTLHGAGQVLRALELYDRLRAGRPDDGKLLELAGIACMQLQRYPEALVHLLEAIRLHPESAHNYNNIGNIYKQLGEVSKAIAAFREAIRIQPDSGQTWLQMGGLLEQSGRAPEAAEAYLAALGSTEAPRTAAVGALSSLLTDPAIAGRVVARLSQAPQPSDPLSLDLLTRARASLLASDATLSGRELLERASQALASGEPAIAIRNLEAFLKREPGNPAAWNNLGIAHRQAHDLPAAERAFQRAADLDPGFALAWSNLGSCFLDRHAFAEAGRVLERAVQADSSLANAHANLGMLYRATQETGRALQSYQRALELDPALAEAHLNLGNLRYEHGDHAGAARAFAQAAVLRPTDAEVAYSQGVTEADPAMASRHLARALALRPGYPAAEVARAFSQLQACDWEGLDTRLARIEAMVQDPGVPALAPFWMLALSDSRRIQQICARKWTREKVLPRVGRAGPRARIDVPKNMSRVRVGVLSGDLRDHAVGHLLVDVLPRIDPARCELWAYDVGPDDGSTTRDSLRAAFHTVRDMPMHSAAALAERMQADGLDVLVDLSGYSLHSRSQVLGLRPAPVQLSYLGFPGTMGWDAVDGLIADAHLVPVDHAADYDESIVRLPVCYQPARRFRIDDSLRPSRAAAGLPEHGLVLAGLGNPYKLRPAVFSCWLRLLAAHPGSVLWLAQFNSAMSANLRSFAQAQGIDPARLVFAPMVNIDAHMARLALADLCLDTAPYGSGVSATQALWAGVPLLTLEGETYVGRMASSLLHAIGLPALVATDLMDYEQRALRLAGDDAWRNGLRAQLQAARHTAAAFDVERSARDLENTFLRLAEGGQGLINR